jgi:hypothetical protein
MTAKIKKLLERLGPAIVINKPKKLRKLPVLECYYDKRSSSRGKID